jgi:uncharacterized protein YbcI
MAVVSDAPLLGDELLAGVIAAMVAMHQHYHHRIPVTAKTLLLGDEVLVCVLAGVYTDVEKTMIEVQRGTLVQQVRSAFQVAMQNRFISAVERLSGREVLAFISDQHVGPDIEIELFMLKRTAVAALCQGASRRLRGRGAAAPRQTSPSAAGPRHRA